MDWRNEAASDLPRPSPREPRTLRQDLLDEVQDHLLLAAEQERETNETASDDEIRKNVIERFGNPAAVVRRLWWEAMKEAIMRDRIIAGAAVVTALAFVLFVVGVWMQMSNRQDALLSAIQELKQGEARPEYETTLVLHRGSLNGPSAEGIEVQVTHKPPEGNAIGVEDVTGPDGSVTFKFQNEGNYDLTLFDPVSSMTLEKQLTIFAGHGEGEEHIAAPDIGSAELRLQTPLPPEIRDQEALLLVELGCEMTVEGSEWRYDRKLLVGHRGASKEFRTIARGSGSAWGVHSEYFDPGALSLEKLQAPDLPVSLLTVCPAVLELRVGMGHLNNKFTAPVSTYVAKYPPGKFLLEPGAEGQLIPIEENMLEEWLEMIRYQRGLRFTNEKGWAQRLGVVPSAFLRRAQSCAGTQVERDEQSNLKVYEDRIALSDSVVQMLDLCGESEALLIQAQEPFQASEDGKSIEMLLAWPTNPPPEGSPNVYFADNQSVKQLEVEFEQFEEPQWGRIVLPPEIHSVNAGAVFMITIPGISPGALFQLPPLLAEFEEVDLTLAKEAMELCPEAE